MRILILQFLPARQYPSGPRFDDALGVASSVLRQDGHATGLLPVTGYDEGRIRLKLAHFRPQIVYADVAGTCVDLAHRTIGYVALRHCLPVVCGGVFATVAPKRALSMPGVQAAVIGEPEVPFPAFIRATVSPDLDTALPGVWLNCDGAVVKHELAPLTEDLDALPDADRSLFAYQRHIDETHEAEVSVGRGCPHFCAYCINDWLMEIYENKGTFVRRRSPDRICDEIDALRHTYDGIRRIRFREHLFALDASWLATFTEVYRRRCGLPFRCHVRANALTEPVATLLAEAGCGFADIEVISGSDFVRNEIFDMELTNPQIVAAFDLLARHGIAARSINYLGTPYASEVSIEESVALNRRVRPSVVEGRVYYPFVGTRAAELCAEEGWISNRGESSYRRDESVLDMPNLRPEVINKLARRFRWDVAHPQRSRFNDLAAWWTTGPAVWVAETIRRLRRVVSRRDVRETKAGSVPAEQ